MNREIISSGKKTEVGVIFDVVRIEIHCGDDYEAQVLFDDIVERLQAGHGLTIGMRQAPSMAVKS